MLGGHKHMTQRHSRRHRHYRGGATASFGRQGGWGTRVFFEADNGQNTYFYCTHFVPKYINLGPGYVSENWYMLRGFDLMMCKFLTS